MRGALPLMRVDRFYGQSQSLRQPYGGTRERAWQAGRCALSKSLARSMSGTGSGHRSMLWLATLVPGGGPADAAVLS